MLRPSPVENHSEHIKVSRYESCFRNRILTILFLKSELSGRQAASYQQNRIPQRTHHTCQCVHMSLVRCSLPRWDIAVFTVIPAFLEKQNENTRFCAICREDFELGEEIAIFGCCMLRYHIHCASKWLNIAPKDPGRLPRYVTCQPCTARWDRIPFNHHFPPQNPENNAQLRLGRVVHVDAGIPPRGCSVVEAYRSYHLRGRLALIEERVVETQGPFQRGDTIPAILDRLLRPRLRIAEGSAMDVD
jgi:hypothetical protein